MELYVGYVGLMFIVSAVCLYLGGHHDIEMHWAVTASLAGAVIISGFVATQLGLPAKAASIHDLAGLVEIIFEYGGVMGVVAVAGGSLFGYWYGNSQRQKGR